MSRILVYKLGDLVQQRFLPMKSIGGNCLIVGERSMSVSSRVLQTVEGDSVIHVRSSSVQAAYVAEYHLSSDTVSPAIDDCSLYMAVHRDLATLFTISSAAAPVAYGM